MLIEPVRRYRAPDHHVKLADGAWERRAAAALRHQVFCVEGRIFAESDSDAIDAVADPIVALATQCGQPDEVVGTVRIHFDAETETWWGSRLAVQRAYRGAAGMAAALIRMAVSTANARGCTRFRAHVLSRNALLFQKLHWASLGETTRHGQPHHLMEADLAYSPPLAAGAVIHGRTARAA